MKKGISLIVLIVTIIVIIILAAAVILTLNRNNPIDSSRVAQLADNRASINSAVNLYYGKVMAATQGVYEPSQIFTKKDVAGTAIPDDKVEKALVTETKVTVENVDYYLIDTGSATSADQKLLGMKLPSVASAKWYLDINTGLVYLIYDSGAKLPTWMFTDPNANPQVMDTTLAAFVKAQ